MSFRLVNVWYSLVYAQVRMWNLSENVVMTFVLPPLPLVGRVVLWFVASLKHGWNPQVQQYIELCSRRFFINFPTHMQLHTSPWSAKHSVIIVYSTFATPHGTSPSPSLASIFAPGESRKPVHFPPSLATGLAARISCESKIFRFVSSRPSITSLKNSAVFVTVCWIRLFSSIKGFMIPRNERPAAVYFDFFSPINKVVRIGGENSTKSSITGQIFFRNFLYLRLHSTGPYDHFSPSSVTRFTEMADQQRLFCHFSPRIVKIVDKFRQNPPQWTLLLFSSFYCKALVYSVRSVRVIKRKLIPINGQPRAHSVPYFCRN